MIIKKYDNQLLIICYALDLHAYTRNLEFP